MDSISPLAKILAEANGIDWRSIPGSGDGGSVVEQDILNYLSRIMSGDEEPPATPVDEAPPGWTGEMPPMPSVAAGGLQALSAAGVESDITDFVAQQAQVTPAAPVAAPAAAPESAAPEPETLVVVPIQPAAEAHLPEARASEVHTPEVHASEFDASEFEIDEEPGAASHPGGYAGPVQAAEAEFELDDLGDAEHDFAGAVSSGSAFADHAPLTSAPSGEAVYAAAEQAEVSQEPAGPAPLMLDIPQPAGPEPVVALQGGAQDSPAVQDSPAPAAQMLNPEPAAAAGFGLGGFLSRLYGGKAKQEQAAPDAPVQDAVQPAPVQAQPVQPEVVQPEPIQPAAAHAEPAAPLQPEPVIGAAHDLPAHDLPAHDLGQQEQAEPLLGEPLISQAPPIPDTPVAAPLVADQWRDQEAGPAMDLQAGEHPSGPLAADLPATGPAQIDYGQSDLGQPIALPDAHEDASNLEATQPAPLVPATAANGATGANAVTLRLNVDLAAVETARTQLSEALFRDVPMTLLVARAAARSLGTLGLQAGGRVALANHAGQPLAADPGGELRASLDQLKQVSDIQPALTVLDAAELGLDELHRGECSLSVGRMTGGGSALSLRGDLDPVRGAQFLHEVEGLLHTPIKLLF